MVVDQFHLLLQRGRFLPRGSSIGICDRGGHHDDGGKYDQYVFHRLVTLLTLFLYYCHVKSRLDQLDDQVEVVCVELSAELLRQVGCRERYSVML